MIAAERDVSIPDVHGQLLFRDEPLATLRADVLPALIALVGLLTEVQTTPSSLNILQTWSPSHPIPYQNQHQHLITTEST